jgi:hypothetical protein
MGLRRGSEHPRVIFDFSLSLIPHSQTIRLPCCLELQKHGGFDHVSLSQTVINILIQAIIIFHLGVGLAP